MKPIKPQNRWDHETYETIDNTKPDTTKPTKLLTPRNLWNHETIDTTKPMKPWNVWLRETVKPLTPRNLWNHETFDTTKPMKLWNLWLYIIDTRSHYETMIQSLYYLDIGIY